MLQTLQFPAFSQSLQKSAKGLLTGVGPVFKSRPSLGDDLPDGRDLFGVLDGRQVLLFLRILGLVPRTAEGAEKVVDGGRAGL